MRVAVIRWARRVLALAAVTCVLLAGGIYWQVQRTAGGFEEWVGDTVSDIRTAHPALVGPVAWLEDHVHEYSYRLSLWRDRGVGATDAADEPGEDKAEPVRASPENAAGALVNISVPRPAGGGDQLAARGDVQVASIPRPGRTPLTGVEGQVRWSPYPDPQMAWLKVARVVANPDFPRDPALALLVSTRDAQLHWQPGSLHPCRMGQDRRPLPDDDPRPDRTGRIPGPDLQASLIAFGGGFESTGFRMYGAIHQGRVMVPLTAGQQTLVIYNDGSVKMGPWGKDLPSEDIREARQNLPPLVHQGRIPSFINWLNVGTLNVKSTFDGNNRRIFEDVHTWRSGMGLTAGGDIVYVFGPRLTPELLAATLIRVGAVEAMQLDVNAAYHCAPALFKPRLDGTPALVELYPGVIAGKRFISGSRKDFFFIRARNESQRGA